MACIKVVYGNHIDLTWRRPRYVAGETEGWKITPYVELQEQQIDRALDFIREGGVFSLEQTISLRDYLERNPAAFDEIAGMIRAGKFSIQGGGESVVDYNVPDGESLIRNHLYSRLWLRSTFGVEPQMADLPDTFGLSAGLPGLFRQLGYRGMLEFSRVFKNHKKYWRGLSDDVIALESAYISAPTEVHDVIFIKSRVCALCGGDGCSNCEGRGYEYVWVGTSLDKLEKAIQDTKGESDILMRFGGEETVLADNLAARLREVADRYGMELQFISREAMAMELHRDLLDNVDNAAEEDIDERIEGNPMASGCFTARMKIKLENRRCEAALRTAERLAVAASMKGRPYPAKTLEYWWRKLMFIQFHDAIPASHSDDAYDELMELGRALRTAVDRITFQSLKVLLDDAAAAEGEGIPFAVCNPLEFDVQQVRLTGAVQCDNKKITNGVVVCPDGTRCDALAVKVSRIPESKEVQVEFLGDLPAFGYGIFRFIPTAPAAEKTVMPDGCVMENDYLRVEFTDHSVKQIYDKTKGCVIAAEGTFAPHLVEDAGHPWGRTGDVWYIDRADVDEYHDDMLPAKELFQEVSYEKKAGCQITTVHVRYARTEQQIRELDWTADFILADNSRELRVEIRTVFDASDKKLQTLVRFPQKPKDGLTSAEIPLGRITRGQPDCNKDLGYADEWPALRYVSADIDGVHVTLCNNGTPAYALFLGDTLCVSMLRTPTQLGCGFGVEGTIDPSEHLFVYTLAADDGAMESYRRGMQINAMYPSRRIPVGANPIPTAGSFMHLPNNLPMLTLKGAEDGKDFICRYLGEAEATKLVFSAPATESGILEDTLGKTAAEFTVPKFTIRTYRITEDVLLNK